MILVACKRRREELQPDSDKRLKTHVPLLSLAVKNAHSFDSRIVFLEDDHTYWLDEKYKFPISVSGVWASFFDKFDPVAIVNTYFYRWAAEPSSKYHQIILDGRASGKGDQVIMDEIMAMWAMTGELASKRGSYVHRQIELALNDIEHDDTYLEMTQFRDFRVGVVEQRGWLPYRTEWSIYDADRMIAGQIDCIFVDAQGAFHMVDWKCCRKPLDPEEGIVWQRHGSVPCHFLLDNKFNHYAAQQNLYAVILLDIYGIALASMSLVQFTAEHDSYRMLSVPRFYPAARSMLDICSARCLSEGSSGTVDTSLAGA